MSIFARKIDKSAFGGADRVPEGSSAAGDGALQKQVGKMLSDRDCNDAFASRISPAVAESTGNQGTELPLVEMAHAAENGENLKAMNASAEQTAMMLDMHPSSELYAHLENVDRQAAVDMAVQDHRVERLAMESDNIAVRDEVKLRRTGMPATA